MAESLEAALVREAEEGSWRNGNPVPADRHREGAQPELYGDALHHIYASPPGKVAEPSNICDEQHGIGNGSSVSEMRGLANIVDPGLCQLCGIGADGQSELKLHTHRRRFPQQRLAGTKHARHPSHWRRTQNAPAPA